MGPAYAKGFRHRQAMARPVFVTYGEARKPAGEAEVGGLSGELGARLGGKQTQGTETEDGAGDDPHDFATNRSFPTFASLFAGA